jgi:hypothetical protein
MTQSLRQRRTVLLLAALTIMIPLLLRTVALASYPDASRPQPLPDPGEAVVVALPDISPGNALATARTPLPGISVSEAQAVDGSPLVFENIASPLEPVPATWDIHYAFVMTNVSDSVLTNVVVTTVKDRNTYYHESLPLYDNRIDENTFVWYVGDLQPGVRFTVLFIVSTGPSVAGRVMQNTATIDCDQTDPITDVCYTLMGPIPQTPYPGVTYTPTQVPTSTPTETPTPTLTPTEIPGGGATIRLAPAQRTVLSGQSFDEQVIVEAGAAQVAAADVFLNMDPQKLEIVGITDGSGLEILFKAFDPATGQIDIGAGNLGAPVSGTFELATLHLRAKETAQLGTTSVTFSLTGARRTVLKDELDHNLLSQARDANVDIVAGTGFRVFLPIMVR